MRSFLDLTPDLADTPKNQLTIIKRLATAHLRHDIEKVVAHFKRHYNASLGIVVMFKDNKKSTLVMK